MGGLIGHGAAAASQSFLKSFALGHFGTIWRTLATGGIGYLGYKYFTADQGVVRTTANVVTGERTMNNMIGSPGQPFATPHPQNPSPVPNTPDQQPASASDDNSLLNLLGLGNSGSNNAGGNWISQIFGGLGDGLSNLFSGKTNSLSVAALVGGGLLAWQGNGWMKKLIGMALCLFGLMTMKANNSQMQNQSLNQDYGQERQGSWGSPSYQNPSDRPQLPENQDYVNYTEIEGQQETIQRGL